MIKRRFLFNNPILRQHLSSVLQIRLREVRQLDQDHRATKRQVFLAPELMLLLSHCPKCAYHSHKLEQKKALVTHWECFSHRNTWIRAWWRGGVPGEGWKCLAGTLGSRVRSVLMHSLHRWAGRGCSSGSNELHRCWRHAVNTSGCGWPGGWRGHNGLLQPLRAGRNMGKRWWRKLRPLGLVWEQKAGQWHSPDKRQGSVEVRMAMTPEGEFPGKMIKRPSGSELRGLHPPASVGWAPPGTQPRSEGLSLRLGRCSPNNSAININ